jgi:hypothetical protein
MQQNEEIPTKNPLAQSQSFDIKKLLKALAQILSQNRNFLKQN